MPEGTVAHVMAKSDGFDQVLVEAKSSPDGPRDLGDFQRVSQARSVVIAERIDEDLGFVLESAEGLGVEDAISISLEASADGILLFGTDSSKALRGFGCEGSEHLPLPRLDILTHALRHDRQTDEARDSDLGSDWFELSGGLSIAPSKTTTDVGRYRT